MIKFESLPYFGKINSISRIIKYDNYYLIKRYDAFGNEKKDNFVVPIKLKNTRGIIEDYCKDIKDYLLKNENKYNELKKQDKVLGKKFFLNNVKLLDNISKVGIFLGTMLVGISFSLITMSLLFWGGMIILVLGSVGELLVSDINKELVDNQFVLDYDNYSKKLSEFRSCLDNKFKFELTKYNGLSNELNRGNSLKMKKVKTLN